MGRSEKIPTDKYIIMIMTMKMIVIMVMNTFAREPPLHSSPPDIVRQMLGEKAEASMPYFFMLYRNIDYKSESIMKTIIKIY